MVPFSFHTEELRFVGGQVGGAALYWPQQQALLVADLHLEKASFFAKDGQMLPPYDSRETLHRLALAIRETGARRLFALGDNFHDDGGVARMDPMSADILSTLTQSVDWVWIVGNHDPSLEKNIGGEVVAEAEIAGIMLRHKAKVGETAPELSGHYHPKLIVKPRGRRISRACAVISERRMILPAFGAFTGGMDASAPEILNALQPAHKIDAILPARNQLVRYPLWRKAP